MRQSSFEISSRFSMEIISLIGDLWWKGERSVGLTMLKNPAGEQWKSFVSRVFFCIINRELSAHEINFYYIFLNLFFISLPFEIMSMTPTWIRRKLWFMNNFSPFMRRKKRNEIVCNIFRDQGILTVWWVARPSCLLAVDPHLAALKHKHELRDSSCMRKTENKNH